VSELGEDVGDRLVDHEAPVRTTEHDQPLHVDAEQQGLVVEHLLEVRNEPFAIGGVASETTADVVVHAARTHGVERRLEDALGAVAGGRHVGPQHQLEMRCRRELRRLAEAAPLGVERLGQGLETGIEHVDARHVVLRRQL